MYRSVVLLTLCLSMGASIVAHAATLGRQPGVPFASDAHRPDSNGAYGGYKYGRPPMRGAGDARDRGKKEPYYYRYYGDTDRSPDSCRRYARRAIETKNDNWWTRYRACLE